MTVSPGTQAEECRAGQSMKLYRQGLTVILYIHCFGTGIGTEMSEKRGVYIV